MSATEAVTAEISEPLTWAEICARHPDEWVCLVEMDRIHPNGFEFRTARVVGHGKTRRAPCDQALLWLDRYQLFGHYYTGHIAVRPLRPVVIIDDETRNAFGFPP